MINNNFNNNGGNNQNFNAMNANFLNSIVNKENSEENSALKNNTNHNSLYKETITISQKGSESKKNKKNKIIQKIIVARTKDFFGMEIYTTYFLIL